MKHLLSIFKNKITPDALVLETTYLFETNRINDEVEALIKQIKDLTNLNLQDSFNEIRNSWLYAKSSMLFSILLNKGMRESDAKIFQIGIIKYIEKEYPVDFNYSYTSKLIDQYYTDKTSIDKKDLESNLRNNSFFAYTICFSSSSIGYTKLFTVLLGDIVKNKSDQEKFTQEIDQHIVLLEKTITYHMTIYWQDLIEISEKYKLY